MVTKLASPGVIVQEKDFTRGGIDPSFINFGAIAGTFEKGPIGIPTLITTEAELLDIFGKPTDSNFEYWFSVSNFLEYGGICYVVRAEDASQKNAVTDSVSAELIKTFEHWEDTVSTGAGAYKFASRTAGQLGNSLGVSVIDRGADQVLTVDSGTFTVGSTITDHVIVGIATTTGFADADTLFVGTTAFGTVTGIDETRSQLRVKKTGTVPAIGDQLATSSGGADVAAVTSVEERSIQVYSWDSATNELGVVYDQYPASPFIIGDEFGSSEVTAVTDWYDAQNVYTGKKWFTLAGRPGTSQYAADKYAEYDEMHVIVYDVDGKLSGTPGAILETFTNVSKILGAKTPQGENNYFVDVIKSNSAYVYAKSTAYTVIDVSGGTSTDTDGEIGSTDEGTSSATLSYDLIGAQAFTFSGGADDMSPSIGEITTAYEEFNDTEEIDIDFIIQGPAGSNFTDAVAKSKYVLALAEGRRDCMAFISPYRSAIVGVSSATTQLNNIVDFFNQLGSSSYSVFDSGYKYMYDRFNDVYRYVPLNADLAGLMVNTATVADPWFSPAGLNRGNIRNSVKLAFNPKKSQRDTLYTSRINPVCSFPGEGTVLFGDKTALAVKSAFDRINVRKLFLVVEKAISRAARAQLFEFNDVVTRTLFTQIVDPYLRDVQARRGLTDYLVVCDETNNTPDVVDSNEFRADIYIKPARSINFITLTFVATRTGVSFDEVIALNRGA
jgi:hypothetical protein